MHFFGLALSTQKYVPLLRAYCSENLRISSKFLEAAEMQSRGQFAN